MIIEVSRTYIIYIVVHTCQDIGIGTNKDTAIDTYTYR